MGSWGVDSFGNDDAADWAWQLDDSSDLTLVEATLERASVSVDTYLEAPAACEGVAAAEAIARLRGAGGERTPYSESVDNWVARIATRPSPEVVARAVATVDRVIATNSELRELWDETEEVSAWLAAMAELRGRLTAPVS